MIFDLLKELEKELTYDRSSTKSVNKTDVKVMSKPFYQ